MNHLKQLQAFIGQACPSLPKDPDGADDDVDLETQILFACS